MINIVKDIEKANFVTHSGKFHADDLFATILLECIYKNVNLIRLPEVENINLNDKIVYDIGGGKFDHHQLGGNGERPNGIKYASFGLLWKELGRQLLQNMNVENVEDCFFMFDKNFVQFIDAIDNGQVELEKIGIKVVSVSDVVESYNPNWNEIIDTDIKFNEALDITRKIFINKIQSTIAKCQAKKYVDEAIEKSSNHIMVLDRYMPYEEFIFNSKNEKANDILYVVFKSNRGGYNVRAISKELGSFECRKKLPKEWGGLRNEELQKVTGIKTASFCHNALFICVADNLEDAMKLATIAVDY